jgi:glucosamine 6-phosphate synthetase-like amidotransferase/phosphosugar isomerase protein
MCSIFGIGLFKDHKLADNDTLIGTVSRLFKEAQVAGREASGLSIMREKTVHVLRRPLSGSTLISTEEYMDFMTDNIKLESQNNKLMSIIGHCRFPTQGSKLNNLNNHPQVCGNIIGVHNGHIGNDSELFASFSKVIDRQAEVDTEIIFQLIRHFNQNPKGKTVDAIQTAAPYLGGSYACGMQNTRQPYNLYIFRHSNPAQISYYPKMGMVFFATREHFITKAWEEFANVKGSKQHFDLVNDQGIVFNLWNKTSCTFRFKNRQQAQELRNAG